MSETGPPTYPVNLLLEGVPVLVVGAGRVGRRKIAGLLDAGARVTVVSPEGVPEVEEWAAAGRIDWRRRPYDGDVSGDYRLVFCATDIEELNRRVAADAEAAGLFVNVADVPPLCSFYLPARVRRGRLQIAVNSDGSAPFASRRLRQRLERQFGPRYADWQAAAADFRDAVLDAVDDPAARDDLFDRFVAETLPPPPEDGEPIIPDAETWRGWIDAASGSAGQEDTHA